MGNETENVFSDTAKEITIDHYKVKGKLARGGMGIVYLAYEPDLDRQVALKFLSAELSRSPKICERFALEAKAAATLQHPNIVSVFFRGNFKGRPYFAMEYIDGGSLEELGEKGLVPPATAVDYMIQTAKGLDAAWKKSKVHRDIKPANLMVTSNNTIKIADFGLAKALDNESGLTTANMIVGTPDFISPEQAQGDPVDCRSDIYSLGATFYFLSSSRMPFTGDTAMGILVKHINSPLPPLIEQNRLLPPEFCETIEKMMHKKAEDRFQDYDELINHLEKLAVLLKSTNTVGSIAPSAKATLDSARVIDCGETVPGGVSGGFLNDKGISSSETIVSPSAAGFLSPSVESASPSAIDGASSAVADGVSVSAVDGASPPSASSRTIIESKPHQSKIRAQGQLVEDSSIQRSSVKKSPAPNLRVRSSLAKSSLVKSSLAKSSLVKSSVVKSSVKEDFNRSYVKKLGLALLILCIAVISGIAVFHSLDSDFSRVPVSIDGDGSKPPDVDLLVAESHCISYVEARSTLMELYGNIITYGDVNPAFDGNSIARIFKAVPNVSDLIFLSAGKVDSSLVNTCRKELDALGSDSPVSDAIIASINKRELALLKFRLYHPCNPELVVAMHKVLTEDPLFLNYETSSFKNIEQFRKDFILDGIEGKKDDLRYWFDAYETIIGFVRAAGLDGEKFSGSVNDSYLAGRGKKETRVMQIIDRACVNLVFTLISIASKDDSQLDGSSLVRKLFPHVPLMFFRASKSDRFQALTDGFKSLAEYSEKSQSDLLIFRGLSDGEIFNIFKSKKTFEKFLVTLPEISDEQVKGSSLSGVNQILSLFEVENLIGLQLIESYPKTLPGAEIRTQAERFYNEELSTRGFIASHATLNFIIAFASLPKGKELVAQKSSNLAGAIDKLNKDWDFSIKFLRKDPHPKLMKAIIELGIPMDDYRGFWLDLYDSLSQIYKFLFLYPNTPVNRRILVQYFNEHEELNKSVEKWRIVYLQQFLTIIKRQDSQSFAIDPYKLSLMVMVHCRFGMEPLFKYFDQHHNRLSEKNDGRWDDLSNGYASLSCKILQLFSAVEQIAVRENRKPVYHIAPEELKLSALFIGALKAGNINYAEVLFYELCRFFAGKQRDFVKKNIRLNDQQTANQDSLGHVLPGFVQWPVFIPSPSVVQSIRHQSIPVDELELLYDSLLEPELNVLDVASNEAMASLFRIFKDRPSLVRKVLQNLRSKMNNNGQNYVDDGTRGMRYNAPPQRTILNSPNRRQNNFNRNNNRQQRRQGGAPRYRDKPRGSYPR